MERNFTIKTVGSKKGTTRHITQKLFSFLLLFLFTCATANADNLLDLVVNSTDVTCPGANDGTATAIPIDGWAPFTYNWSNGENTSTITGLAPGLYEVTVVDGDGAIEKGEVYINEGDGLDLFMSASYETCPGSSDANASVNASGGTEPYSYLWSTGETFVVASNLSAGTYTVTVTDDNGCSAVGSVTVELSPEGVWLNTYSTDADCGLDNGTATVVIMTGEAPFVIEWSNGAMTEEISGLAPGTYTVTVTDANGCSNTESVEIDAGSDLGTVISGTDASCAADDGSATVTVTGGTAPYTYEWSNGGNTATITGLSAGTYTVTVSDASGCASIKSIQIDADGGIDVDVTSDNADCNEDNGSATASANNGTAPYTYEWSNGSSSATISGLAPGSYTVTATDANGCSDTETVNITGSEANGGNISTNDELEICAGDGIDDIVNVTLTNNSGENSQWVITNPSGDIIGLSAGPPFNFDGAGTGNCVIWHLSYEDGLLGLLPGNNVAQLQGCYDFSNSITVIRNDPEGGEISTNDPTNICVNDGNADLINVSLTGEEGPNSGWIITDEALNILDLPASPPFNFENAGVGTCLIWHISYVDGLNGLSTGQNAANLDGCFELSNSITVIRNEGPTVVLNATDISCANGNDGSISTTVSGGDGNYSYSWSTGATTSSINNLDAGNYSVTVTDGNGCFTIANALIVEPSSLTISTTSSNESCLGSNDGTATATVGGGTAPYSYNWSNGGTTATINGLAPGTYSVTVTDANGCMISNVVDIVIGSDGISSCSAMVTSSYNEGVDISTFDGSDGTASAMGNGGSLPYTYQWSNGQSGANADNLSAGTYTVTITDAGGCTCTADVTLNNPSKIGNFVWEDINKDGIQDPGEPGIGNVTINLTGTATNGTAVSRTVNTSPDGSYQFDGLLPGNYKVTFSKPAGYAVSPLNAGGDDSLDSDMDPDTGMSNNFDLGQSECNNTIDAGLYPCVNIGDFVFYDGNRDGIQQVWEAGYADAQVRLMAAGPDGIMCTNDDVVVDGQVTGNDGRYLFECVEPGNYYIQFVVNTAEYMITDQNVGGNDELDSDADPTTGKTDPFTVTQGMPDDLSFDAGVYLICDDFTHGGEIGYDQEICPGELPNTLVSINLPSGGYGASEYLWLQSTTGGPIGGGSWMEIPDSDSPTYDPPQLYQTTFFVRCARRENCDNFVVESNIVTIVVNSCIGGLMQNLTASVHNGTAVAVEWTTQPESLLYRYQVERSFDGVSFEALGTVNGLGDLQTANFYEFMDEHPRIGRNIYRVVRENLVDGQLAFSDQVEAMFDPSGNRFFVYPNPTTDALFIESLQNMNGNAMLELYNATGQLLEVVEVDYNIGKAEFNFNKYTSGVYLIKVNYADKDDTDVIRIIKE